MSCYAARRIDAQVISHIIEFFRPGAIVLQMGADSLAGDKLGGFNLTLDGEIAQTWCVQSDGQATLNALGLSSRLVYPS